MTILDDINKHKIIEVAESKRRTPLDTLKERIPKMPAAKSFSAALRRERRQYPDYCGDQRRPPRPLASSEKIFVRLK